MRRSCGLNDDDRPGRWLRFEHHRFAGLSASTPQPTDGGSSSRRSVRWAGLVFTLSPRLQTRWGMDLGPAWRNASTRLSSCPMAVEFAHDGMIKGHRPVSGGCVRLVSALFTLH